VARPHYPDPSRIIYPTTDPPKNRCQLTSWSTEAKLYPLHEHDAYVDHEGCGTTTVVASHFHRVRGGRVLPDESDGHVHRLTGLPCGAG